MSGFSRSPPKFKIVTFTRNLVDADGAVAITGVGFRPSSVIVIGAPAATGSAPTIGMCDASLTQAAVSTFTTGYIEAKAMLPFGPSGTNYVQGQITSLDADGFTVTWTKQGSPTGTDTFYALCFG